MSFAIHLSTTGNNNYSKGAGADDLYAAMRTAAATVSRTDSAIRGSVAVRRLANPVTVCDGDGACFMAASGQIPMAADIRPRCAAFASS